MDIFETLVGPSIGAGALWSLNDATRIFASANKLLLKSVENGVDGQVFSIDTCWWPACSDCSEFPASPRCYQRGYVML